LRALSQTWDKPFRKAILRRQWVNPWLTACLHADHFQGLGNQFLSGVITYRISLSLLGLSGLMILAMIGVTIANWKAK
jgi:hypothetical protein